MEAYDPGRIDLEVGSSRGCNGPRQQADPDADHSVTESRARAKTSEPVENPAWPGIHGLNTIYRSLTHPDLAPVVRLAEISSLPEVCVTQAVGYGEHARTEPVSTVTMANR
jgi:hypothetical protein